nr:hypothetical protein 1 [Wenzhou picorna-like virus 29]
MVTTSEFSNAFEMSNPTLNSDMSLHFLQKFPTLRYLDLEDDAANFDLILSVCNDSLTAAASSLPLLHGGQLLDHEVFRHYFHTLHLVKATYSGTPENSIHLRQAEAAYDNLHLYIYTLKNTKVYFFEIEIRSPEYTGYVIVPGIEFYEPPPLQDLAKVVITDNCEELEKLPLPQSVLKHLFFLKGKAGAYIERIYAPRVRAGLCVQSAIDGYDCCDVYSHIPLSVNGDDSLIYEKDKPQAQVGLSNLFNLSLSMFHADINVQDLMSSVKAELSDKITDPDTLSTILAFVSNFAVVYRYPDTLTLTNCVINMLNVFNVSKPLIECLMKALAPYFSSALDLFQSKPKAQSFQDVETVSSIGPILLGLLSVVTLSRVPPTSCLSKALKLASDLGRAFIGISSIVNVLPTFCLHLYDVFHVWLYGVPRDMTQFEQFEEVATRVFTNIAKLSKIDNIEELRTNTALRDEIRDVRFKAHLIFSNLLKTKVSPQVCSVYRTYLNKIDELAKKAELHGGSMRGPRKEPLCVMFSGASGQGKSQLPLFLATDILLADGQKVNSMDDVVQETYVRNVTQKHYNGYRGQTVFVYDDFGQVRDSNSNPNEEYIEIIKSQNMFEYPLLMADLLEKNNTFFVSKAIILTSNSMNHNIQSLTCAEAFNRRIHLRYEVKVEPACRNDAGMMDAARAKAKYGDNTFKAWEFHSYAESFSTPGVYEATGEVLSYDAMRKQVVSAFIKQMDHSDDMFHRIGNFVNYVNSNPIPTGRVKAQVCFTQIEALCASLWMSGKLDNELFVNSEDYFAVSDLLGDPSDHDSLHDHLSHLPTVDEFELSDKWSAVSEAVQNYYIEYNDEKFDDRRVLPELCFLDKARAWYDSLLENVNYKVIAGVVALASTILAGYSVFKYLFPRQNPNLDPVMTDILNSDPPSVRHEASTSGDSVTKTVPRPKTEGNPSGDSVTKTVPRPRVEANPSGDSTTRTVSRPRVEGNQKASAQAYIDCNSVELLKNRIATNLYRMFVYNDNSSPKSCANALFITSRVFLTNEHVWRHIQQFKYLVLQNRFLRELPPILVKDLRQHTIVGADGEEKDACLVVVPRIFPAHRTITKLFATSTELSQFNSVRCALLGYEESARRPAYWVNNVHAYAQDSLVYEYGKQDRRLRRCYSYQSLTTFGDCGSVLIAQEPTLRRKVLGIHVAGGSGKQTGKGFATSITEDDLTRSLEFLSVTDRIECEVTSTFDDSSLFIDDPIYAQSMLPEGEFIPLGRAKFPSALPTKGDIYPSPLFDKASIHQQLPAALTPFVNEEGEVLNPMKIGLKKCGAPYKSVDPELLDLAATDVLNMLRNNTDPAYRRLLTHEEMIKGSPDLEFICPVKRRSSPGYQWTAEQRGMPGKTRWLGDGDNYILDDPDLMAALIERERKAKMGIRHPHLWQDTLKVERRPIYKVNAGKTRVFSMGQMDYNLLFRKYFLGFNANAMKHRIQNELAIGITPQSYEWTALAHYLTANGDNVFAGDFANYDGTLIPEIMWKCLDVINEWYDDGYINRLVRAVLFEEIVSSIHICGDFVYGWTHSQPSGNPLTTILNSLYNSISMRVVYYMALRDLFPGANPIKLWRENIRMISYGDDNVVGVRPGHFFNQELATKYYAMIGMTYTDESKSGKVCGMRRLKDVTFLKRGFLLDGGTWYCPLALDTILEMVQWVRGVRDQEESCSQTVEVAYEELAYHEFEVFDKWSSLIQIHANNLVPRPALYSWAQYRHFFYSSGHKSLSSSED